MPSSESSTTRELEKTQLEMCFIPIICSAPLIYAHRHGFFEKNGLDVNLRPAPGWSGVKALIVHGQVDAVHMLSPMPLSCSLGIDGRKADIRLATVQNVNGGALTLAKKHLGIKDVRDMKGFTFGVPYRFSMHYYLLCHFLANNGLNPLKDVTIREIAPPRMPYYIEKGWVDGVFAPEPFNQIPVYRDIGFIYILSKDIWPGHPCCSFATRQDFMEKYPHTYRVLLKSVLEAELALHRADPEQRKVIAREICGPQHLNQDDPVPVEQALAGDFPDGTGAHHKISDRIDFIPYPWEAYGNWILSQMQRWAQLPGKVDYREVVESVFETKDARELAEAIGFAPQNKPSLGGVAPFTGDDPFAYMMSQPYTTFQERRKALRQYDLSAAPRKRLSQIIEGMAKVAGGQSELGLQITSDDELGLLEQTLNEMVLNTKFAGEALAEQTGRLEERVKARTAELSGEIAERKRAQEALSMKDSALAASTNGIAITDRQANLTYVNRSFLDLWGYDDQEEVLGRPATEFWQVEEEVAQVVEALRGNRGWIGELTAKRKDGSLFSVQVSASVISDDAGELTCMMASFVDISERKRAEQALRESEEKHRVITQAAQDAIIVADATGAIRFWNRAAETIFGYGAEEIVGRNMIDTIVPPQYHQAKRKGFAEFAKTGRGAAIGKTLELTALRKDGTEFPIEISLSGYRGRDGFVAVAVVRDITDRKRAEEDLRGLAMIAEQAGEGIGVADLDGTLQFVNAAWAEMHGFQTRDELVGKHLSVFHTDEQMKTDVIPFNEEVKRSGYHTGQVGHVRRDGSQFPTEMTTTLLKDAEGEPIGLIGFVEDITERKRAEQAIREERDRAQSYLDIAGTMIALVDASERITLINQKGCEILGYQREDLLGENWFNLLVPQRIRAEVRGVFQKLMAGHTAPVEYCENPLLTRDGEERLTAFHNTVLTEPSGRITAVLFSAEDITERKNAEERLRDSNTVMIRALEREKRISASLEATMAQLERARQATEAATRSKSEFLANMSHEIRTPMTAILGFADVLLEQGNLDDAPPERAEAAEAIRRNGEYLLGLLNDILDLSKIEAGKMTVERIDCSLCRTIAEVASLARVRTDAKGLAFNIEYLGAVPEIIQSDPTRLRQILINLIGNAIKFSEVGSVQLITRFVGDGPEPLMQFDMVDTGIGMTAQQVAGLFQPFTQADASTTRKYGGTGLGLTISQRLAELLGGEITVIETAAGVGTRMRVSVPTGSLDGVKMIEDPMATTVATPTAAGDAARTDERPLAACHILLAEDGPDNQRLIVHMLKKAGAQVTVVENGSLVVDVALAARNDVKPFDVILMDMQMPVIDGYRATRLLRQKGYTAPIVALTAHAMASDREKCIQAGCNDYTAKPINRKELIETIRKHLPAAVVS